VPVVRSAVCPSARSPVLGLVVRPLFVFFNPQRNRVKMLVWTVTGFCLRYKRLEAGSFAALDRDEINAGELRRI
jgi:IS66 Orf2 like protein